jgi:ATP-binding cassette subfamily B protein
MTGLIQRWREVRGAFAHTPQAVRLVWQTSPWATVGLGLLTLGGALLPAAQAWVGKLIVDGVVAATKTGADPEQSRTVFIYLIVELILFLLSAALNQARRLIQQLIQLRLANRIRADIIRKALSLDLAHFEHPEFYDRLQNARREGGYKPTELINDTFQIVQNIITMASFAVLLFGFSPWLVAILLATSIPAFVAETRFSEQGFRLLTRRAPESRQINYLSRLLTEDGAAKEIKLFNLGDTLLGRYVTLFEKFFHEDRALALKRAMVGFSLGLLTTLGFYGSYAWIVWRTVQREISLGDMTLYLAIFRQGQSTFQSILSAVGSIYENNLFMANLFDFLGLVPQMSVAAQPQKAPLAITHGVEFRGVGFCYPENAEWTLRHIDLTIRPGSLHDGCGPIASAHQRSSRTRRSSRASPVSVASPRALVSAFAARSLSP